MLARCVLVLLLVSSVITSKELDCDTDDCVEVDDEVKCQCVKCLNYTTVFFLSAPESTTKLAISNCTNVELGPGYLQGGLPLAKVSLRHIKRLILESLFPPELNEFYLHDVQVEQIAEDNFSGDTRLKHLRISNSTIHSIKRDTFEAVAVENARFEHVNFVSLEEDSLAFSFNMSNPEEGSNLKAYADISFHGCRFPDVDFSPVSVASPGRIKFADNVLNCTSLPRVYTWLDKMLANQHDKKMLLCQYLGENYCETKRDSNTLMWKLLDSGLLSNDVGLNLEKACPEYHQMYLEEKKRQGKGNGWMLKGNFAVLVFSMIVMAK